MTEQPAPFSPTTQSDTMQGYYKWHARIYDWTRWTFLWGRRAILRHLELPNDAAPTLLEVGCGTGFNLRHAAAKFPNLRLIGVDVSADMLAQARKHTRSNSQRIQLVQKPYGAPGFRPATAPDAILFSYALTMFNPGWEDAIRCAYEDLQPGGRLLLVDFHDSPLGWFKRWMGFNHVRMDSHLLPELNRYFKPEVAEVRSAYFGWWKYLVYAGVKAA